MRDGWFFCLYHDQYLNLSQGQFGVDLMNRTMIAVLALAALTARAVFAADDAAAPAQILDEPHFLSAADDAARRGDKDAAVQLFQSAIIYAPNDPAPYAQLGRYYATTGQSELAAQFFNSALSVQPAYAPALHKMCINYNRIDKS